MTTGFFDRTADLWQARRDDEHAYPAPFDVQRLTTPSALNPPHLQLIDQAWQRLARLRNDPDAPGRRKLLISIPPQEGKSQRGRAAIPWWLRQFPDDRVVIASFEFETATRWGRSIRNDARTHPELNLQLRADSAAAGRWDLEGHDGGVYCVGVGGAITGRPADLLLIDDPVKGRASVESQTYRDSQWEWWINDVISRLGPHSVVVMVMTRWHEDDIAARVLANEPGEWDVINIAALAEADDPLHRPLGEPLESVRGKDLAWYAGMRDKVGPYVWTSLYQGRPTPTAGGLFKRTDLRYWTPGTDVHGKWGIETTRVWSMQDTYRFATMDLAASLKTSADWTVFSVWATTLDSELVLLDRVRARVEETEHAKIAMPLIERWKPDWVGIEDSGRSVNAVAGLAAAGVGIRPLKADADKVTRALAATAKVARQQVWLPAEAPWLDEWVGEMLAFPNGAHDDQVDTLAYAARTLLAGALSADFDDTDRYVDHDDVDFLTMPL